MGFAMQSFFIGLALTLHQNYRWFYLSRVDNTAPLGIIPDSVKYSFYFGGIAFIVTVLWLLTSKEYSPEELAAFEKHKETSLIKETHSADLHLMENLT
jgi:maltose/moltooligosaccharide transporter